MSPKSSFRESLSDCHLLTIPVNTRSAYCPSVGISRRVVAGGRLSIIFPFFIRIHTQPRGTAVCSSSSSETFSILFAADAKSRVSSFFGRNSSPRLGNACSLSKSGAEGEDVFCTLCLVILRPEASNSRFCNHGGRYAMLLIFQHVSLSVLDND